MILIMLWDDNQQAIRKTGSMLVQPLRSRGSTHRSRQNPLGRRDSAAVRLGNLLCCRALVLVVLAAAKGCFWVLEQPGSSTMEYHPLFQRLMRMIHVRRLSISMSDFGAPTKKHTYLYTGSSYNFWICTKPFSGTPFKWFVRGAYPLTPQVGVNIHV